MAAIEKAGYRPGEQIALALDAAASEFGEEGPNGHRYRLDGEGRQGLTADDLIDLYAGWCDAYPDRVDRGRPRRRATGTAGGV